MILENLVVGSWEWQERRKMTIGSSEIATVLGLNKYQTPLALWAEKTGRARARQDNPHMCFGREIEAVIKNIFCAQFGIELEVGGSFANDLKPWATATPDYFRRDRRTHTQEVVEIKNTRGSGYRDGATPEAHHLQVIWQLGVLGLERGKIVAMVNADPSALEIREIEFDSDLFAQMLFVGEKFMQHLRDDTPPLARDGDSALVFDLQKPGMEIAEASEEIDEMLGALAAVKAERAERKKTDVDLEARQSELQSQIMQACGDKSAVKGTKGEANWKRVEVKEQMRKAYSFVKFNFKGGGEDEI